MLPFKSLGKEIEAVVIEDGFGNSLEIPKYGCLTPNEANAIGQYYVNLQTGAIADAEAKLAELTILLKSRFKLDLTSEELADQAQTMPMIERLYDFLMGERTRWVPKKLLLDISGEKAKEVALASARDFKAIVASRPDLATENRWIVIADSSALPSGFEIVADYTNSETVGKSNAAARN